MRRPSIQLRLARVVAGLAALVIAPLVALADPVVVPPGNRSATQPPISGYSVARTKETGGSFEGKYRQVYAMLARDHALIDKIKTISAIYGIDPIHVIGALVGEHTYNVDAIDTAQGYYMKAMEYLGTPIVFRAKGVTIAEFVAKPQFARCASETNDYDLWDCREEVWNTTFRGKTVDGIDWPNDRFGRVFFQPLFAGQTFGLGQLSPLAALSVADIVHEKGGQTLISMDNGPQLYHEIMDPDSSLHYVAAVIRLSIDAYRQIAGFDISENPGITATLYNLGDVRDRARALKAANAGRSGADLIYPQENYYGWLINEKLPDLQKLLGR
ncbi:DUF1402 family protein [Segnochrobactrum spirostomi]|uniref:DUF1402 family protein n=1 Tax=Segnochrobactrum spirostomi TaxID=2608987 RepID=A0A6A7Y0K6_9HYPH|nr:DUF1402 family protein [Segnochrobactrum spirostomi]MQT12610.1 DUF1402 family protein [Segnochrobactrum spirostomi]